MNGFDRPAKSALAVAGAILVGVVLGSTRDGSAAAAAAPVNSTPPTISGSVTEGATLTTTDGVWSGAAPISYSYQWLRCDSVGGSCSSIIGSTTNSYVLKNVDLGTTLRAVVTATNTDGPTSTTSVPTAVVKAAIVDPPRNTAQPSISGATVDGATVTANKGSWSGSSPISYSYHWIRCNNKGDGCVFLGGTTTQNTYLVTAADVGNTVRVDVTGSNTIGSSTARSPQTDVIQAKAVVPPPADAGCPKKGGTIPVAGVVAPARLLIDQLQVSPSTIQFSTRTVTARIHITACGGSVQGALVYATAVPYAQFAIPNEQATDAEGWVTLQFNALAGFPTTSRQQLLVMFVRARKPGGSILGGISSRRLLSVRVTH